MYNVHPHFGITYLWYVIIMPMYMPIMPLFFPSKIWAKKCALYTAKYSIQVNIMKNYVRERKVSLPKDPTHISFPPQCMECVQLPKT